MGGTVNIGLPNRVKQRGLAMIALLSLFALVSSYLVVNGMQRTKAEVSNEQERQSSEALKNAKAALIAYTASKAWTVTGASDQPGALPCPDTNNDGVADSCGASNSSRIGRIPWKTLGISDLRDSSGEVLWYALSNNFRETGGTAPINSDTQGTLTITGSTSATQVVAVIIAPGQPLSGQDRTPTVLPDTLGNSTSNFLESTNTSGSEIIITTKVAPDTWRSKVDPVDKELVFNDSVVTITQAEIMALVEPAVASRIEQYIKPYLTRYFYRDSSNLGWSSFPFPAEFSSATYTLGPGASGTGTTRAQSSYVGSTAQTSGLLPITASANFSWTTGTVTKTGGTYGTISGISCATSASAWVCNFTLTSLNSWATCVTTQFCMVNPMFKVTGGIGSNAGISFADLPTANSVTVTNTSGSTNRSMSAKIIGGTLTAAGVGTVNLDGTHSYSRYNATSFNRVMRVTIPAVVASSMTGSSDADAGWFIKNEWYRQTYYAVSSGFLPGGTASCTTSPTAVPAPGPPSAATCLMVNNLFDSVTSTYTTKADRNAILIFSGRALATTSPVQSHPSSVLVSYLEGANNQNPTNKIFDSRDGKTLSAQTFNDRVIVISP